MRMACSVTDDASFGIGVAAALAVSRSDAAGFCASSGTASTHVVTTIVPTLMMPPPSPPPIASVTDREKIRPDDGTPHGPLARLRRRRAGGWRTVLGLKEIRDVLLGVY